MEWLLDPAAWVGLLTLVVLEIVLGIDNLIFIAILADKLPPAQRDRARIMGLSLALIMRLGLLSVMSWLVTLTTRASPAARSSGANVAVSAKWARWLTPNWTSCPSAVVWNRGGDMMPALLISSAIGSPRWPT